jgi:hypothetical protein
MERTTTTAADIISDCEQNVLARQMIRQRFVFRASVVGLGDDYRAALPAAGNVAVEVFKRERQLIGIQAFGATPELRSRQLAKRTGARIVFSCGFDSIPFDLGVLTLQEKAREKFERK